MASAGVIDTILRQLATVDLSAKDKFEAAVTLRDHLDHYTSGPVYPQFLKKVMPVIIGILSGPPSFQSESSEQKLRNCMLEIIHRFPSIPSPPEPFEPYAEETIDLLSRLIRTDNEDNACLCIKTVCDILRHQSKVCGAKAQAFLLLVKDLFDQTELIVKSQLDHEQPADGSAAAGVGAGPGAAALAASDPTAPSTPGPSHPPGSPVAGASLEVDRPLLKGMQSFKVIAECPIIVVSIFQMYRSLNNIKPFIPVIKAVLSTHPKAQDRAHAEANARGANFFGMSPLIRNKTSYGDYITLKVKMMSFLAYALRQHADLMADFLPALPSTIVRLLRDCPRDKAAARKELIVAIRHIINFNYRLIFVSVIEQFLDERTLMGDGLTVHETMRPLAYSMLADLIHHVRDHLKPPIIRKTVAIYTRNLLDDFPGTSFQTMSAKLLLNMAECIAKMDDKVEARYLLVTILNAIADKFASMNRQYNNAVKLSADVRRQQADQQRKAAASPTALGTAAFSETYLADMDATAPAWDEIDIFTAAMPIKLINARERGHDPVVDNKFLFKTLMHGLRNTVFQLRACTQAPAIDPAIAPAGWSEVASGFNAEEVQVIVKLLREGARVFRYYEGVKDKNASDAHYASTVEYMANFYMASSSKEEKDLLEMFATVFHVIDPATFNEIFGHEVPHLFAMTLEHPALLHIPQFFLASDVTSPTFCGMLLRFLMDHIEEVGLADVKKASVLLRLFKLAFMAVTLFAAQNEQILLPYVVDIISKSVELSTHAQEPMNYFFLLRSLFRSIGGGKFEHLYKQILPLLEMLLDVLNNLLLAARKPVERDLYVELCLTVPARLSNLLPHLNFLMRPLVAALRAGSDMIGQGLRTLELCVDNLTAEYLDPLMAPVLDELMPALYDQLRPHPYSHFHAHTAMRILGKLGGRNRKHMTDHLPLTFKQYIDDVPSFDVRLVGSKKDRAFNADLGLELALQKIMEVPSKPVKGPIPKQSDAYYKKQALQMIEAQIKIRIGYDKSVPEDLPRLVRLQAQDLLARKFDVDLGPFEEIHRDRSVAKKRDQEEVLTRLLKALLYAESIPELRDEADAFLMNICRHFVVLDVGRSLVNAKKASTTFDATTGEGPLVVDAHILADALLDSLASMLPEVREAAQRAIRVMFETAATIFGSERHVHVLEFFGHLSSTFTHGCYVEEWFLKTGACLGIHTLLTEIDLGEAWVDSVQMDFIRALLFVVKDMPPDLPDTTMRLAQKTLEALLDRVTKGLTKDDVVPAKDHAHPRAEQDNKRNSQTPQPPQASPAPQTTPQPTPTPAPAAVAQGTPQPAAAAATSTPAPSTTAVAAPKSTRARRLPTTCNLLAMELSHMNKHVRSTAKKSLEQIAKNIDAQVWEIIEPHKERLLTPLFQKPLRALPFAIQIGLIDALTYFLTLKTDFVAIDDDVDRLLTEALALSDASDTSLAGKSAEFRTHNHIVQLRVACIRILSTAMGFDEYQRNKDNKPSVTRAAIVSMFFNRLYADSDPTSEAANEALKRVFMYTSKLPKDLLQQGLRPVLASLQDAKRLTPENLEHLALLLRLLTNYFKVEIGSRLLDHVGKLAQPAEIQRVSFMLYEQSVLMNTIVGVFGIFPLLPDAARMYKERIIDAVLDLEEKLRRTHHSPLRAPVYKYLNRYPDECCNLLTSRIEQLKYGRFLAQALDDPDSQAIRDYCDAHVDELIKSCNTIVEEQKETRFVAVINTVHILHSLAAHHSTAVPWMEKKENLMWLKAVAKTLEERLRANAYPPELRLAANQAAEQLMAILTKYLDLHVDDTDMLLSLVECVTAEDLRATPAFHAHIYKKIVCNESVDFCRSLVLRCLEVYAGKKASHKTKSYLLHNMVNPIVAMDVMRHWDRLGEKDKDKGSPLFADKQILESINSKIWQASMVDSQDDAAAAAVGGVDYTRMEVMQLTAMIVKYHHVILQDLRKDTIKFGWTYIRNDDAMNKNAAYVLLGYFIAHYETPVKIVSQVYYSLLKTNQSEGRALVSQALELIAPVLPKRFKPKGDDRNAAVWAAAPRRILAEESHNAQQTSSIFQFLVRHPDLFYELRDKFTMLIILSLQRVASPANASSESKRLALNLMWLIWQWEYRRVEGKPIEEANGAISGSSASPSAARSTSASPMSRKRRLEGDEPGDPSSGGSPSGQAPAAPAVAPVKEYQVPQVGRQKMLRFLVKFIAQLNERYELPSSKPKDPSALALQSPNPWSDMCKRSMALLYNLLHPRYWGISDVELQSNATDVVLASDKTSQALANDQPEKETEDKFINNIINMLQVVRVILNFQTDEWIVANIEVIQKILERSLKSDNPEVQDCLHTETTDHDDGRKLKSIVARVLETVPEDVQMEDADGEGESETQQPSEFVTFLSNIATETLGANNYMAGINILWSLAARRPTAVDVHIPAILKALQAKLGREHLAHYAFMATIANNPHHARAQQQQQDPAAAAAEMTPYNLEIQTGLIIKAIDVAAKRIETLGDNRRPFLSVLANLVEKSQHIGLCTKILDMVEGWVFKSEGTWPTLKEKTAVLHKMLGFEHRPDLTMLQKFLDLVIRIYEDPKIARTEITVRLEHAFLIGTRAQDVDTRNRFLNVFSRSLAKAASDRLMFVITDQNWEMLADTFWLSQASHLLMGAVEMNATAQLHPEDIRVQTLSQLYGIYSKDNREPELMMDDKYEALMAGVRKHVAGLADVKVRDLLEPLTQLQHTDNHTANELWVMLFPLFWGATLREDRPELERGLVGLLTKDYHNRQMDKRPNVIQALLAGASRAWPDCKIPPHVMKHLARIFDVWYVALTQLERSAIFPEVASARVRESNLDALVELYADLKEEDLFYGTWRRRCRFLETNSGLSYEQNGMWDKAQRMYEAAQVKARTSVVPYSQAEYMLWEDHWVICAQKLQQWDILQDFAKHENFQDLLLECAWRNFDMWQEQTSRDQLDGLIKGVMDAPTPRRAFFQSFMSLLRFHHKQEAAQEFNRSTDEAIQLSIRKWHQLPRRLTNAHIPLMQQFQLMVEIHDASIISNSLSTTVYTNLDAKSSELKLLLGSWRDRLPNMWDDVLAWQDLVTWRQHIFNLINNTYLNLLPAQGGGQPAGSSSFAYRGYHETAWIINRFAHVARKHDLSEVCINQLGRIYTLPNIEIQEAFLKLREQAKCHFQNPDELTSGLDVINNTNLNYFNAPQKAEFYTLKGMFLEKLSQKEDANVAFGTALHYDITTPKAWAEWGFFNDRIFQAEPTNYTVARQALTCYLQASASYKNAKVRKLISRILWLLSLDDAQGTIASGFDDFKGEMATWYWITFIPQLLSGLNHKEAPRTHEILLEIAQTYPQALYFVLRTSREDMLQIKKNQEAREAKLAQQQAAQAAALAQAAKQGSASPSQTKTAAGAASGTPAPASATQSPQQQNKQTPTPTPQPQPQPTAAKTEGGASRPGTANGAADGTPAPANGAAATTPAAPASASGTPVPPGTTPAPAASAATPASASGTPAPAIKTEAGTEGAAAPAASAAGSNKANSAATTPVPPPVPAPAPAPASATPAAAGAAAGTPARNGSATPAPNGVAAQQAKAAGGDGSPAAAAAAATAGRVQANGGKRHPWDYMEEILVVLKSSFPLLALSMETVIDQIQKHLKCPPDEDAYRLIVALLNDAMSYISRSPTSYSKDVKLPTATESNIMRFAETVLPTHIRPMFEAEFVAVRPTMYEYIQNLRQWRNKFEDKLDRRSNKVPLEQLSPHLCEFRYLKMDDIEIPGQYLQLKDKNSDFIRIDRFIPQVELIRTVGVSHRRIRIRGHDGSIHPFAVQQPTARNCRREERALQLFRQLNQRLSHKKESRRRDLQFTLPLVVPVAQHIRLVQDDPSYVSMQTIYEEHCRENGFSKDDAAIHTMEKLAVLIDSKTTVRLHARHHMPTQTIALTDNPQKQNDQQAMGARAEVLEAIQARMVPNTVLINYFQRTFPDFGDYFLFRRRFAYQYAATTFMTFILCADKRYPHKINIGRGTGNVWSADVMPFMPTVSPYFKNPEPVPFRLTPNLQALMGPLAVEGIFSCSIMAIARSLAEPEQELSYALTLFVRDEIVYWFTSNRHAQQMTEDKLRRAVQANVDVVTKRAVSLAQTPVGNLPAYQTVIDLIAKATNPVNLAMCDVLWMAFL
ncbi:transformation/transcription domain-associated protein [Sporothrix schenckii 1099-18]|uniref:Transformation/transcription domain-associated protein n=1 Tax=Sporothrix schenckii 1099-18 TaxID=1397361 RepID=A0A0F2M3A6_SPOSC|nr:transformation/transcription domain-associated protein [Sporothrix schenckii 1099-18]KJR83245.1 transformation/transcription domain-associated protein [Sporothrix schenckii 1099-18]